jgi:D-alanyl-D-alanine carboxypeptidase/D-alanyl-D-alanine-endopeptidase (penicillin-binding protein 4)
VKKHLLGLFFLTLCFHSVDGLANSKESLRRQISPLLEHLLPRAAVGIAVADAKTGHIIYEHNAFQAFNPASCAKLFSTSAALYELGPDYHFKTEALYNKSQLADGTLNGNLSLRFSGDPSLTVDKLKSLVNRVHEAGVRRITGNVEIDNTAFAAPWYGPGWSQEDLNWYFAAPITSVILNQNAVGVNITSNPTLNNPASLKLEDGPLKSFLQISHTVNTVTYEESMKACEINIDTDAENHIHFQGCWPSSQQSQRLNVSIRNPDALAKKVLAQFLKEENIQLDGNIITRRSPEKLTVLASIDSLPLKALVTTLLKDSNNIYAECITKALGRQVYHQGTFLAGSRAIKSILKKQADINFDQSVLVDGSGQSRYDLVTPRQIVRLLYVMQNENKLSDIFINALPESGTDGTLKGRFQSTEQAASKGFLHYQVI